VSADANEKSNRYRKIDKSDLSPIHNGNDDIPWTLIHILYLFQQIVKKNGKKPGKGTEASR